MYVFRQANLVLKTNLMVFQGYRSQNVRDHGLRVGDEGRRSLVHDWEGYPTEYQWSYRTAFRSVSSFFSITLIY